MLLKQTITALSGLALLSVAGFASAQTSVDIPDPTPINAGTESISLRVENSKINNEPYETQLRFGLLRGVNLGYSRSELIGGDGRNADLFNAHVGLNQATGMKDGNNQISAGFVHYDTRADGFKPVYYVEDGYTVVKNLQLVGGDTYNNDGRNEGLIGALYQVNSSLKLRVNYRSGTENFTRYGFVYGFGKTGVTVEPQVLVSNSDSKNVYGYLNVGYTFGK